MLSKYVFTTAVYYDVMDYPLTSFEFWKHLLILEERREYRMYHLAEIFRALQELVQDGRLILFRGFYVLPGRESLVEKRIREEKISVGKLKRAKRLIRHLAWVPFVRMIAIAGSLAMKKGEEGSDWDFFIVLKQGRIWLGRTFLTGILQLLGKRRHGRHIANRACLNYFITEGQLEVNPKDVFGANEYHYLFPMLDRGVFRKFELANRWISTFQPQYSLTEIHTWWRVGDRSTGFFTSLQQGLEIFFGSQSLENWLSGWQKKKIAANPKTALPGSFIQTTDEALIFLPKPRGPLLFERFKVRLSQSGAR